MTTKEAGGRKSVWKDREPELFNELIEKEVERRLRMLNDSKRELKEAGVPREYWVYLDANHDIHVDDGSMLGSFFEYEDDVLDLIDQHRESQVFHIDPTRGNHVSVAVDIRDEEKILFHLSDEMSKVEYLEHKREFCERNGLNQ